jgi:hypothetical protein
MDIGALIEQRADQGRGNIGQPPRFGGKVVGHVAHAFRKIRDFGRHHQYGGIAMQTLAW